MATLKDRALGALRGEVAGPCSFKGLDVTVCQQRLVEPENEHDEYAIIVENAQIEGEKCDTARSRAGMTGGERNNYPNLTLLWCDHDTKLRNLFARRVSRGLRT